MYLILSTPLGLIFKSELFCALTVFFLIKILLFIKYILYMWTIFSYFSHPAHVPTSFMSPWPSPLTIKCLDSFHTYTSPPPKEYRIHPYISTHTHTHTPRNIKYTPIYQYIITTLNSIQCCLCIYAFRAGHLLLGYQLGAYPKGRIILHLSVVLARNRLFSLSPCRCQGCCESVITMAGLPEGSFSQPSLLFSSSEFLCTPSATMLLGL